MQRLSSARALRQSATALALVASVMSATGPARAETTPVHDADRTGSRRESAVSVDSAAPARAGVLIEAVPHVRQKPDFCGEACAAMYLQKLGQPYDQDAVFDLGGVDPLLGRGCYAAELNRALRTIGFDTGRVWHRVDADTEGLRKPWQELRADLARGVPSIVCMLYDDQPRSSEHFRLVLGYDADGDEVIYHEPAVAQGAYRRMSRSTFLKLWPLKYREHQWTVIRMRLKPGTLRPPARAERAGRPTLTDADYAQHIMKLKPRLPHARFRIVIRKPFVVIGDERAAMVRWRADSTVRWAVEALRKDYFEQDPPHILDVWLFKDKASYEKHARQLFGRTPHTPFGYYSAHDRALVMNIATGGGTLTHEIVHPFMAANFPACPAWFNEGLGSLYEQCRSRDGRIVGLTNWRLAGLQAALKADQVPTFKQLTATTEHEFYNQDQGTHYAQARYLCYYLQEQGLLRKFYHKFVAEHESDPTGYKTLQSVLGEEDMAAFQEKWKAFVLKLRYP